jgi:hypothetical protein
MYVQGDHLGRISEFGGGSSPLRWWHKSRANWSRAGDKGGAFTVRSPSSMRTTSSIEGRSAGSACTHQSATNVMPCSTCWSRALLTSSRGSTSASTESRSWLPRSRRAKPQVGRNRFSSGAASGSKHRRPLTSSSVTTPRLYTSTFAVSAAAGFIHSGAMYPRAPECRVANREVRFTSP